MSQRKWNNGAEMAALASVAWADQPIISLPVRYSSSPTGRFHDHHESNILSSHCSSEDLQRSTTATTHRSQFGLKSQPQWEHWSPGFCWRMLTKILEVSNFLRPTAWGIRLWKSFVKCFLRVLQAFGLYSRCGAAQVSTRNFQKTFYKTWRPRL